MGNYLTGRHRESNDQVDPNSGSFQYFYPPKNAEPFFSDHFIMGGEKFDTIQPEAYLFGENLDLNFLGQIPRSFPYSPPLPNKPIKTLRALINIRRESVRFVKAKPANDEVVETTENQSTGQHVVDLSSKGIDNSHEENTATSSTVNDESPQDNSLPSQVTTAILSKMKKVHSQAFAKKPSKSTSLEPQEISSSSTLPITTTTNNNTNTNYNIEFIFDSDVQCAITIFYFCMEEATASSMNYISKNEKLNSSTYLYERGSTQIFSQPTHVFNPAMINDNELAYRCFDEEGNFNSSSPYPVVIQCTALEGDHPRQSNSLIATIEKNSDSSYSLKPLKQKIFIDGLCYLIQEIYGIEKKSQPMNVGNRSINDSSRMNGTGVEKIDSNPAAAFLSPEDDLEDDGSECVICMSEPRDTLILPCKHLCLCNVCADSLRYQASNCPICRSPFRALLLIKAARKSTTTIGQLATTPSITTGAIGQSELRKDFQPPPTSTMDSQASAKMPQFIDINEAPPGYEPIPLIEALNGPSLVPIRPPFDPMARNRSLPKKKTSTSSAKSAGAESLELVSNSRRSSIRSNRITSDGLGRPLERPTGLGTGSTKKINLGSSLRNFDRKESQQSSTVATTTDFVRNLEKGDEVDNCQNELDSYGLWHNHFTSLVSGRGNDDPLVIGQGSNDSTASSSNSGVQETARLLDTAIELSSRELIKRTKSHERSMNDISERESSLQKIRSITGDEDDEEEESPLYLSMLSINMQGNDGEKREENHTPSKLIVLNSSSNQPQTLDLKHNYDDSEHEFEKDKRTD